MANNNRKRNKLMEYIKELEIELAMSLQKKTSAGPEINVPMQTRKIQELKEQLKELE